LQGAQGKLVEEEQGEQARAEAVADVGHQVEEAAQHSPSPLQVPLPSFIAFSLSYVCNNESCGPAWWLLGGISSPVSAASVMLDVMLACWCAASLSYIPASTRPLVHVKVWRVKP